MKRKLAWVVCLFMFLSLLPPQLLLAAEAPVITAEAVILVDADSGKVLYEKNSQQQRMPASVTKMMTLLLAVEAVERGEVTLDDVITVSTKAAYTGGSTMYLKVNEQITFNDLLYGLAMVSANDASVAIGEHISGSLEAFVPRMNQRAAQLGMANTHFMNTHGLKDAEHYTTAYDLSLLAREAIKHPLFLQITGSREYAVRCDLPNPTILMNSNELLGAYDGMDGLKTGWIGTESGYCLATTVKRGDVRLICILLGAETRPLSFSESEKLLDYGFAHYETIHVLDAYEKASSFKVADGNRAKVAVGTVESIELLVGETGMEHIQTVCELTGDLTAPLEKDTYVGQLYLMNEESNEIIANYNLVALETIKRGNIFQRLLNKLINFF